MRDSGFSWVSPPQHLSLKNNDVHVWLVRGDNVKMRAARFEDFLSSAERDRAVRFKFVTERERYVVAHAALRSILATYLAANPRNLQFEAGPNGKPKLACTVTSDRVEFNLSHSHEAALIAVTVGRQVGVDIEYIKREFQWEEIAERFFAPGEVAALQSMRRDDQQRAFFACWTRKEAYIKAKGGGLSIPLQDFEVSLFPHLSPTLRSHKSDPEEINRWSFSEIDAGPDYAAALAAEGHEWKLECFRWRPETLVGSGE